MNPTLIDLHGTGPRPTHPTPVRPPKAGNGQLPPGAPHPDAPPDGKPGKLLAVGLGLLVGAAGSLALLGAVMGGRS